jgi:universal stress protein A
MMAYKKNLVAVDLSSEAKPVVARAREFSEQYGSALCLIHVTDPIITEGDYELRPALPLEVQETIVKRARGYLDDMAQDMGIPGAERVVKVGSIKHEILHYAQKHNFDLIVIGTHGRHGVAALLGSTANSLLHGTPCDVMCVRVGG